MNLQQLGEIKNNFIKELENATNNSTSSLPFIRHTLSVQPLVEEKEIFQTLVIGGSFYQKAVSKRINGNIKILHYEQGEQPPFLTEQDLMTFVEKHLDPDTKVVALNFAYPMSPVTRGEILDGVLNSGSKENTFTGLVGKPVGESIEKYIKEKTGRDIKVAAANDTICLLLSGLIHHEWDNLAAGIVGTGLNFAIFLDAKTTVNLETANFDKFTQSEAGKEIDSHSASKGDSLYEKEISGAYLYKHFNFLITERNLPIEPLTSTKDLENLVHNKNKEIATTAKEVLEHSASLVAAQIAGIMEFCKRDIIFIMQGSLYWKGYRYKEMVERLVIDLSPSYTASYEQVLHSDLYGAAKLVA
jgi:hexokinase